MVWVVWVLSMKFSVHNLFWPTANFMDLHHPRHSSHFWAVLKVYELTLPTKPHHTRHPQYLADSQWLDACRIEIDQFLQLVYLPKTYAILWNSHAYCNEMKFKSWICNTNSYNLWTKSCILSQLTFWCNLQLVNPIRNSWMIQSQWK